MVEYQENDRAGHMSQYKGGDHGQPLNFLAVMEDGMKSGLKPLAGGAGDGLKNSQNLDAAKLANTDISKFLGEMHLPKFDLSEAKGFLSGKLQHDKPDVIKAANLIDETNTLGTDDQKKQLTKMFEDEYERAAGVAKRLGGDEEAAKKAGEQAVRNLVDEINVELKNRNSESRISLERPEIAILDRGGWKNPWGSNEIGNIVVTRDGEKTDHIVLHEPDSISRNAKYEFKSNLDSLSLETKK